METSMAPPAAAAFTNFASSPSDEAPQRISRIAVSWKRKEMDKNFIFLNFFPGFKKCMPVIQQPHLLRKEWISRQEGGNKIRLCISGLISRTSPGGKNILFIF